MSGCSLFLFSAGVDDTESPRRGFGEWSVMVLLAFEAGVLVWGSLGESRFRLDFARSSSVSSSI